MREDVDITATLEGVMARAGGACEECGARAELTATCVLEGVPTERDTLALCATCIPKVEAEFSAIASAWEIEDRVAQRLARAKERTA